VGLGLVATILLAGAWLGYVATHKRVTPAGDALSSIVQDHLRAQSGSALSSSDSLEVARWLADRLPFAVQVPIFPEARLKGARVLLVNRQSGAVVEYAVGGQSLSYYVLPGGGQDHATALPRVHLTSRFGYRLATWEDSGLTHALVAVLPEPKLLELARYCIHQMMAELGQHGPAPVDG
jgi:anti-sigma factor RsiW